MALLSASVELIAPKTATATVQFTLQAGDLPARLTASGLAGSEEVTLQTLEGPNGTVKVTPYKDGAVITLKVADPSIVIDAPGPYECVKPSTAGASGLYLATGNE